MTRDVAAAEVPKGPRHDALPPIPSKRKRNRMRDGGLDWSVYDTGQFLLKVAYLGTHYSGFEEQKQKGSYHQNCTESLPTIEKALFEALELTRLIRDRNSCRYSKCGRTDKGVHAAGNYISLALRTSKTKNTSVCPAADPLRAIPEEPIDRGVPISSENTAVPSMNRMTATPPNDSPKYDEILNGVLPDDIRIIGYCRVPDHFDARFWCSCRIYKYLFPLGIMNTEAMKIAAKYFFGVHDFRNFCKWDSSRIKNMQRTIMAIEFDETSVPGFCEVTIQGQSFLWHQVRCMMAILFLVGQGFEQPDIVPKLLDVESNPVKPPYTLADAAGLVLFDCKFNDVEGNIAALHKCNGHEYALCSFRRMLAQQLQHVAVLKILVGQGYPAADSKSFFDLSEDWLQSGRSMGRHKKSTNNKHYTPLLERSTSAPSLDEREEAIAKKRARRRQRDHAVSVQASTAENPKPSDVPQQVTENNANL